MKKRNLVLFGTVATLSLALAGSIGAVTASADQSIGTSSGASQSTTTVTYTADNEWKVTIPDSITIGADGQEIKAEGVKIAPGYQLKVTVTSTNSWKVQKDADHQIDYELKATKGNGSALANGDAVLTVKAGTASDNDTLTATLKDGNNYSTGGEAYTDTLTFNVEAVESGD